MKSEELRNKIFEIKTDSEFNEIALEIFHLQYANNNVYHQYADLNNMRINEIDHYKKIPFLPIELFKSHRITSFLNANKEHRTAQLSVSFHSE